MNIKQRFLPCALLACLLVTGCFPEEAQLRKERDSRNFEAQARQIALAMIEYGALWSDKLPQLRDWEAGSLSDGDEHAILPLAEHPATGPASNYLKMSYCTDNTNVNDRREYIIVYPRGGMDALPGQLDQQPHLITNALRSIAGTDSVGTVTAFGTVKLAGGPRDGSAIEISCSIPYSMPGAPVYVMNLQYRGGWSRQDKKTFNMEINPCDGAGNFYISYNFVEWDGDIRDATQTVTHPEIFCPSGGGP